MANPAYTVDFTEATKPALGAMKDVSEIQGMQSRAAYEGAATQNLQQQNAINAYQLSKEQKEKEWNEKMTPMSSHLPNIDQFPTAKAQILGIFDAAGIKYKKVGNEILASNEDFKRAHDTVKESIGMQDDLNKKMIGDLETRATQLENPEYLKQAKLSPEEVAKQKKAIFDQLDTHYKAGDKLGFQKQQNIQGIEAGIEKLAGVPEGADDATKHKMVGEYLGKDKEMAAAAAAGLKTGDVKEFTTLLTKRAEAKAAAEVLKTKEEGLDRRATEANKSREKAAGIKARAAANKEAKTKYKDAQVTLKDGSTVTANYNPKNGRYYELGTDKDITDQVKAKAGTASKEAIVPGGGKGKAKTYKTPEEVRDDTSLTKEQKIKILKEQFKML